MSRPDPVHHDIARALDAFDTPPTIEEIAEFTGRPDWLLRQRAWDLVDRGILRWTVSQPARLEKTE